ncbi:MAG: hypothetical protein WCI36_00655 [bacterium]
MEEDIKQQSAGQNNGSKESVSGFVLKFEGFLDEYMVKKAPFAIPQGGKDFIATVSPYLIIIFAIMALPLIFLALGISAVFAPFAMMGAGLGYVWGFSGVISLVVAVVSIVLEAMAVPGLFKREKAAWRLLFYVSLISFAGNVIAMHGIVGTIIGAVIGWYILFQIKELYKN